MDWSGTKTARSGPRRSAAAFTAAPRSRTSAPKSLPLSDSPAVKGSSRTSFTAGSFSIVQSSSSL